MDDLRESLIRTARRGELHHALILHGPSSELLESIAGDLSRALNCVQDQDPDESCVACARIRRGLHPDVHVISVDKTRKMISIEQIRKMISEATMKPYEGRTKVFIVTPADSMSTQAANSLLKTLEEPTAGTVFLLLTASADRMLPTIRSRAQSIAVRPQMAPIESIGGDEVSVQEARLRASAVDEEDATRRAEFAREVLEDLGQVAQGDSLAVIDLAARIASLDDPAWGAQMVAQVLRDLAGEPSVSSIVPETASTIIDSIPAETLLTVARGLLDRCGWSRVNPDPMMQYEAPLLDLVLNR